MIVMVIKLVHKKENETTCFVLQKARDFILPLIMAGQFLSNLGQATIVITMVYHQNKGDE